MDPVADLKKRVANGQAKLEFEPKQGYLRSILTQLKIDPNSQVLVFSKTSLQTDHISPKTPRALYFNDEVYVGWIPGAPLIEIMSVDPKRGALFYTIENTKQAPGRVFDRGLRLFSLPRRTGIRFPSGPVRPIGSNRAERLLEGLCPDL